MGDAPANVYASVGKAVLAVQYFEHWMNNAFHHMRIVIDGLSLSEDELSSYKRFKLPTKNFLKLLSVKGEIDSGVEARIDKLLEQRHTLVHRWFLHNGTPSSHTEVKWHELGELADSVAAEATELAWLLLGYLSRWLGDSLAGAPADLQRERMSRMFHDLEHAP